MGPGPSYGCCGVQHQAPRLECLPHDNHLRWAGHARCTRGEHTSYKYDNLLSMRTLLAYSFLRGAQGRRGARGRQQRRCGRRATSGAAGTPARSKCSGSQNPLATPRSRSPPARSGPPSGPERRARRLAAEERLRRHSGACHPPSVSPPLATQAPGDVLLMKGGLWEQGSHGGGAAHRAPAIGPVPTCTAHRLMLKVDVSEDF